MSTTTVTGHVGTHAAARTPDDDVRLTFLRIVRSEWIKLRTLWSTAWALAVTVLLMVAVSVLFAFGLGALPRSSPAALASVLELLLVVPIVFGLILGAAAVLLRRRDA